MQYAGSITIFCKSVLILSILISLVVAIKHIVMGFTQRDPSFSWRFFLGLALFFALLFFVPRAVAKGFFPFTDKLESFTTLYAINLFLLWYYFRVLKPIQIGTFLLMALVLALPVFFFEDRMRFPSAHLLTIWYPAHVPLSFAAYAYWLLAAVISIRSLGSDFNQTVGEQSVTVLSDHKLLFNLLRNGFIMFSLAMFFGGIWGFVAWGAVFIWDPKILWSLILWIHYGNALHLQSWPAYRKHLTLMNLVGIIFILITFIGTGFFTRSIHRF